MKNFHQPWRTERKLVFGLLLGLIVSVNGIARGTRNLQLDDEMDYLDLDAHLPKKSNAGSMQMLLRQPNSNGNQERGSKTRTTEREQERLFTYSTTVWNASTPPPTPPPTPQPTPQPSPQLTPQPTPQPTKTCSANGFSRFPFLGKDNAERLLLREKVIDEIPSSRCGRAQSKNVILVIGDGMGWEMVRAGAVAKQVLDELENLGCNVTAGCPNNTAAIAAFRNRTLSDYYTEGPGSGLSFQNLTNFDLVTTTAALVQNPNKGNNTASPYSMLEGVVANHDNGMAPLALNECGFPIDFNPSDHMTEGGNMVLWDDIKGGKYPWDLRYGQENPDTSDGFDPTYILNHATDSSAAATALATGQKVASTMQSVNLYEEKVSTIVEDAMRCGKAAGVVSSKPILHATPGTFISHSNNRKNFDQLRRSFREVSPTFASGTCARRYYPFPEDLQSMRDGSLSSTWTLFEQKPNVMAENFYDGLEGLDPDDNQHVVACMGGDFSPSKKEELPYRGVDSSYSSRWCGRGDIVNIPNTTKPMAVESNSYLCDRYSQEEVKQIPHISANVKAALDFLSKDDDGFFLMYEQGDIDTAAHSNHMDDLLGTMLDIDDSVKLILEWIENNGGFDKNALYVTADHDHYLTLLPTFPERLAMLLIAGESHNITPQNFSDQNPWNIAISAGRHMDTKKRIQEHLNDFSTWTDEDVDSVGHFWGPVGSGGNGWGSHSTRPVPIYYAGDRDCLSRLRGAGYQVLGRDVRGVDGKLDQVHVHACMLRSLFGY